VFLFGVSSSGGVSSSAAYGNIILEYELEFRGKQLDQITAGTAAKFTTTTAPPSGSTTAMQWTPSQVTEGLSNNIQYLLAPNTSIVNSGLQFPPGSYYVLLYTVGTGLSGGPVVGAAFGGYTMSTSLSQANTAATQEISSYVVTVPNPVTAGAAGAAFSANFSGYFTLSPVYTTFTSMAMWIFSLPSLVANSNFTSHDRPLMRCDPQRLVVANKSMAEIGPGEVKVDDGLTDVQRNKFDFPALKNPLKIGGPSAVQFEDAHDRAVMRKFEKAEALAKNASPDDPEYIFDTYGDDSPEYQICLVKQENARLRRELGKVDDSSTSTIESTEIVGVSADPASQLSGSMYNALATLSRFVKEEAKK